MQYVSMDDILACYPFMNVMFTIENQYGGKTLRASLLRGGGFNRGGRQSFLSNDALANQNSVGRTANEQPVDGKPRWSPSLQLWRHNQSIVTMEILIVIWIYRYMHWAYYIRFNRIQYSIGRLIRALVKYVSIYIYIIYHQNSFLSFDIDSQWRVYYTNLIWKSFVSIQYEFSSVKVVISSEN